MSRSPLFSYVYTSSYLIFFFLPRPATSTIYPLSLHDALPIWGHPPGGGLPEHEVGPGSGGDAAEVVAPEGARADGQKADLSALRSLGCRVWRLLLEKKKEARTCTDAFDESTHYASGVRVT